MPTSDLSVSPILAFAVFMNILLRVAELYKGPVNSSGMPKVSSISGSWIRYLPSQYILK
jgi:hypothetical protein